jgi:hypothetical protein
MSSQNTLFTANSELLFSRGFQAHTLHDVAGQLEIFAPKSEEDLIAALIHNLCITADSVYDNYGTPDSLATFMHHFTIDPNGHAQWRPARANMAVSIRNYNSPYHRGKSKLEYDPLYETHCTIMVDNRNNFSDKAKALRTSGESDLKYRARPSLIFSAMLEQTDLEAAISEIAAYKSPT